MIEAGTYALKEELFPLTGITIYQYKHRKDELLEWMKEYFDYELNENVKPIQITIKDVFGEYEPLPTKKYDLKNTREEKKRDYDQYVKDNLPKEPTPYSKAKMSREAMQDFSFKKYGHQSISAVVRRYVGPAMEEFGEHDENMVWVMHNTYAQLDENQLKHWHKILTEEHIDEEAMKNAFIRHSEGEDISAEVSYFQCAQTRFMEVYGGRPIKVYAWRAKQNI